MVSSISSVRQYPVNREVLEVIRRLQSLGVTPTGNLTVDRQRLQTAEYAKKLETLATNSEQNLNKLTGTNGDFSSVMGTVKKQLPAVIEKKDSFGTRSIGLIKDSELYSHNSKIASLSSANITNNEYKYQMIGATQLGELNKIRLGLTA